MSRTRIKMICGRVFYVQILTAMIVLGFSAVLCENEQSGGGGEGGGGGDLDSETNSTTTWNKTGIPQIDYVNDPNLPRELNGYNLSTYPFFSRVPKNINYSCDGLKDGFYANLEYSCQVYHHCLYGTRSDFLCPNYTAFDQRTFICTFVSDVDCKNSADYFHRNNALYIATTTTTIRPYFRGEGGGRRIRPAVLQAERKPLPPDEVEETEPEIPIPQKKKIRGRIKDDDLDDRRLPPPPPRSGGRRCGPRRRRRCRRPRPRPAYYDYDDYYDEYEDGSGNGRRNRYSDYDDYYDELEEEVAPKPRKKKTKMTESVIDEPILEKTTTAKTVKPKTQITTTTTDTPPEQPDDATLLSNRDKIFSQSRTPPRIRPPVPKQEKTKYESLKESKQTTSTTPQSKMVDPKEEIDYEEYYEDEYDARPAPRIVSKPKRLPPPIIPKTRPTTTTTTTTSTTTTTTTTTPSPLYEYEYDDFEEEAPLEPPPTTTTSRPSKILGARRSQSTSTAAPNLTAPDNDYGGNVQAMQASVHDRINGALETPSRVPSLRQPYLNRPRPSFGPISASSSSSVSGSGHSYDTTTTTTTDKYNNINAPAAFVPYESESVQESSTQRQPSQRFWQRSPTQPTILLSSTTHIPDYMDYQDNPPVPPRRYGQRPEPSPMPYPTSQPTGDDYSDADYITERQQQASYRSSNSMGPKYSTSQQPSRRRFPISNNGATTTIIAASSNDEEPIRANPPTYYTRSSSSSSSSRSTSAKPLFISLMQENEDSYYQQRPEQTQNIQVQVRPNYHISEANMRESIFGDYKSIRPSHVSHAYPIFFGAY